MIDLPTKAISSINLPSSCSFFLRFGLSLISRAKFRFIVSMGKVGIALLPKWWPWWSSFISKGTIGRDGNKESSWGRRNIGIGWGYNSTKATTWRSKFSIRSKSTSWIFLSISICGSFISQPTPYSLYSIEDLVVEQPIKGFTWLKWWL